MLLRFLVANHRSIDEPVELSLVAVDDDRAPARRFDEIDASVLGVAGIYGPNASGKSNVLDALAWLSGAVRNSLRRWDEVVPRDAFRFGGAASRPTSFEVDILVGGSRYTYQLDVTDDEVLFEGLYGYPLRKKRTLLEREGEDLHFRRGSSPSAGTRELVTPTTLALSAAMRLGEPDIEPVARAIAGFQVRGMRRRGRHALMGPHRATLSLFEELRGQQSLFEPPSGVDPRELALTLLRYADLGIEDVQLTVASRDARMGERSLDARELRFIHRVDGVDYLLEPLDESEGTMTWFGLIGPVMSALATGQVLLVDEIDASLHPRLSARLIELFQDPQTNALGAQLIFTSHDTSLLNHLNRDEVWLTEKREDGATRLTALADFGGDKVRRSLNLERAYLQGRFGAVPELDQHVLRQALGLAGQG